MTSAPSALPRSAPGWVGLLAALAVFLLQAGPREREFLPGESPGSGEPFAPSELALKSSAHLVATPRSDGDQPLARVWHRLAARVAGEDAGALARLGVGLHALAALCVYLALGRLLGTELALLAALGFGLTPLALECVQTGTLRARDLAALLAALAVWARGAGAPALRACALVLSVLACMAHPCATPVPLAFLAVDRVQGRRSHDLWLVGALALLSFGWAHLGVSATLASAARRDLLIALPLAAAAVLLVRRARGTSFALGWSSVLLVASALLPYDADGDTRGWLLALPGVFLAFGLALGLGREPETRGAHAGRLTALLVIAAVALTTWNRVPSWSSAERRAQALLARDAEDPRGHRMRGFALIGAGKLSAAVESFRRANQLSPGGGDAASWAGIGEVEGRRGPGRFTALREAYGRALELAPDDAAIRLRFGEYLRRDSLEDARAQLARATELAPFSARAHSRLAVVLAFLTRPEEARGEAERAVALDPGSREGHTALGMAAQLLGEREAAEAHYRRALELEPDFEAALGGLGRLLLDQRRYAEALPYLERAYRLHPETTSPLPLGVCLEALDRRESALSAYDTVLSSEPAQPRALLGVARISIAQGRLERAREALERVLARDPSNDEARRLRDSIEQGPDGEGS